MGDFAGDDAGDRASVFLSASYDSPVGELTLCADGEGLRGLWLAGQKYFGASVPGKMIGQGGNGSAAGTLDPAASGHLAAAAAWLDAYFAGERPDPRTLALCPIGSEFRQRVWRALLKIPYGQTATYGQIGLKVAEAQGRRTSNLAVGGAVGHNPISVIVPCHRVVGADGSLVGYAGGLDRKLWLLEHEGADTVRLYRPKKGTAL